VTAGRDGDAAADLLGITLDSVAAGRATAQLVVRPEMLNGHGTCHGGIIFTLADTAFAYACNSHGPPTVAASASIDFLVPVHAGETLTAEAVEQWRRGRTGLYDVVITDSAGAAVARFHGRSHEVR
jgi:acyl-CoA thioesterase